MTKIKIEAAQYDDVEGLVALLRDCAPYGLLRRPEEIHHDMIKEKLPFDQKKWLFIARFDDEIMGMVWAQVYSPYRLRDCVGELTLAVHPKAQSQGLGRRLMVHLMGHIRQMAPQVRRIELMCNPNNTKAVSLYESLGFVREGLLRGRMTADNGEIIDDLLMGWLVEGNAPVQATS
jgi:ribosomal protein S18 acetylase RimI-like enzyme